MIPIQVYKVPGSFSNEARKIYSAVGIKPGLQHFGHSKIAEVGRYALQYMSDEATHY